MPLSKKEQAVIQTALLAAGYDAKDIEMWVRYNLTWACRALQKQKRQQHYSEKYNRLHELQIKIGCLSEGGRPLFIEQEQETEPAPVEPRAARVPTRPSAPRTEKAKLFDFFFGKRGSPKRRGLSGDGLVGLSSWRKR